MDYIGVKALSEKWGLSERRIRLMCSEGRIEGAIKLSWSWAVPSNVEKPTDGRVMKKQKEFIRLGSINIDEINKNKQKYPLDTIGDETFNKLINDIIIQAINFDSNEIREKTILNILYDNLVPSVSLEKHLLIKNFQALLRNAKTDDSTFNARKLRSLAKSLYQGFNNPLVEDSKLEIFFLSLEREYKKIHPIYKAMLTFVHLIKTKPYEKYNNELAFLTLVYIILQNGYIVPSFVDDIKPVLLTVMTKSNYLQIAAYLYNSMLTSYNTVANVALD